MSYKNVLKIWPNVSLDVLIKGVLTKKNYVIHKLIWVLINREESQQNVLAYSLTLASCQAVSWVVPPSHPDFFTPYEMKLKKSLSFHDIFTIFPWTYLTDWLE